MPTGQSTVNPNRKHDIVKNFGRFIRNEVSRAAQVVRAAAA